MIPNLLTLLLCLRSVYTPCCLCAKSDSTLIMNRKTYSNEDGSVFYMTLHEIRSSVKIFKCGLFIYSNRAIYTALESTVLVQDVANRM